MAAAAAAAACASVGLLTLVLRPAGLAERDSVGRLGSAVFLETQHAPDRLCSAAAAVTATAARALELPVAWQRACEALRRSPLEWASPGRNWCWVWTKQEACYAERTWWQAQERAAGRHDAPDPAVVPLEALRSPSLCDRPELGTLAATAQDREAARTWFDQTVSVYVINLPSAVDRWLGVSERCRELGIHATRLPGVDLSLPGELRRAQEDGTIPREWSASEAEGNMRRIMAGSPAVAVERYVRDYGLGTAGCAAAHLRAMRVAGGAERWRLRPLALILEDDAWLEDDFVVKVWRLVREEAPCDWEAISLRSQCPFGTCISPHLTRVQPDATEPAELCRHGVNFGFYAMLYRADRLEELSQRLAHVVWDATRPGCLANDVALAAISDEVAYYAVPTSQVPGFVRQQGGVSLRSSLNLAATARLDSALGQKKGVVA